MEHNYMNMEPKDRPFECTLDPGDIIYFPNMVSQFFVSKPRLLFLRDCLTASLPLLPMVFLSKQWWHATINLDDYTAFVSTFTQEHLFV